MCTAINTPTTHYHNPVSGKWDWHSSYPDSWTRANYPISSTSKSIFDPCPYGYRVPTSNTYTNGNSDFFGFTPPPNGNGASWLGSWWPTSGYRDYGSAAFGGVGNVGNYWSVTPHSLSYDAYSLVFASGSITIKINTCRCFGLAVRCVQEEGKTFLATTKLEQSGYYVSAQDTAVPAVDCSHFVHLFPAGGAL